MKYTAIDFETANSERTSACAIGLILMEETEVIMKVHHLIRTPSSYFRPDFTLIHGLTWADVREEKSFLELWEEIKIYFTDSILYAHNASFDMNVLSALFSFYEITPPEIRYFDTLQVSRKTWRHFACHKLNYIAGKLGVVFHHHNALEDAGVCCEIVRHAFPPENGPLLGQIEERKVKIKPLL